MDDAPNYGNTGGTIGHELTHGFDDEGSQFDCQRKSERLVDQRRPREVRRPHQMRRRSIFRYVSVDDVHINGKLTLGENVADLGGEILAYMAWKDANKDKHLQPVDGLTPEQRFFVGFAQWDCANERPEDLRVRAMTDPHSPGALSHQRRCGEHAGLRQSLLLQARPAHGQKPGGCLQSVVMALIQP